jgi:DNA-binding NarL/FixJ family response regulator
MKRAARSRWASTGERRTVSGITEQEKEIISLILLGQTNKQIGQKFSLSEHTVKHHLSRIYRKLGVSSRLQLTLFAIKNELVDLRKPPQKVAPGTLVPPAKKEKAG